METDVVVESIDGHDRVDWSEVSTPYEIYTMVYSPILSPSDIFGNL